MSTQTEIDAQALGALMVASKKVDGCLTIYEKEPDNLQNLNTLFNGFTEYISASFNFLMMTGCKPPPEYEDRADKYQNLLQPVGNRLTSNKKKLEDIIENCWVNFTKKPDNKANAEELVKRLEEYLGLFGQQRDSKRYNKLYGKILKILKKREK